MTNACMKFEKAGLNQTLLIDQTRLYTTDGPTNRRTDGQTGAEKYASSSSKGGGGKNRFYVSSYDLTSLVQCIKYPFARAVFI